MRKLLLFALLSPLPCLAQEKPRVLVTRDESWQVSGNAAGFSGGSDDRTLKVIRLVSKNCSQVTVTTEKSNAAYVIQTGRSEHGVPMTIFRYSKNEVSVFRVNGDLLLSGSKAKLENAIKEACSAILKDRQ